jgi:hypothetical protein
MNLNNESSPNTIATWTSLVPMKMGLASSSVYAVMQAVQDIILSMGSRINFECVASVNIRDILIKADSHENANRTFRVGSMDRTTVAKGGICETTTSPKGDSWRNIRGHDWFIENHTVVALRPDGEFHNAPELLGNRLKDKSLGKLFIPKLSALSKRCAKAIEGERSEEYIDCLRQYYEVMLAWAQDTMLTQDVAEARDALVKRLGKRVAVSQCGAGCSDSMVIAVEKDCLKEVKSYLKLNDWIIISCSPTSGLRMDFEPIAKELKISAPARVPLIGAADLAPNYGMAGTTLAVAIEPRNTLTIRPF